MNRTSAIGSEVRGGAIVEGMNVGAILLGFLGVLVVGLTALVAFGLLIARKTRAALVTFTAGLLGATVLAALATLSFLQKGNGFYEEGSEPMIVLTVLSLLLAGGGQFITALRQPRIYGAAFGCAAGSMAFQAAPFLGLDALGMDGARRALAVRSLSLPGVSLGLALSLLLAVLSLMIAVLPPRRRNGGLLWTALAVLGGIAGFGVGDACVVTRCTPLPAPRIAGVPQRFEGGGRVLERVRVEVDVLGVRVSDETGFAPIPREGLSLVRAVSLAQAAWVYGPLAAGAAAGAAAGLVAAWGIARLLVRQPGEGVHAEPL
jgi:hypothetical protein